MYLNMLSLSTYVVRTNFNLLKFSATAENVKQKFLKQLSLQCIVFELVLLKIEFFAELLNQYRYLKKHFHNKT